MSSKNSHATNNKSDWKYLHQQSMLKGFYASHNKFSFQGWLGANAKISIPFRTFWLHLNMDPKNHATFETKFRLLV